MEQTRKIELARLDYDHTWNTVLVKIPATTHDDDIFKVAVDAAISEYGDGMYCIYCTYDDEVPETKGAFIIEVTDTARCVARFIVHGASSEEEALEKMGNGDREDYGPNKVLSWVGDGNDEYSVRKI